MYASMDDWLGEVENYSTRAERVPPDALEWIKTAWQLATEAEREACAKIADDYGKDAYGYIEEMTAARIIADEIRARSTQQG